MAKSPKVPVYTYVPRAIYKGARRAAIDLDLHDWEVWTLAMTQFLKTLRERKK